MEVYLNPIGLCLLEEPEGLVILPVHEKNAGQVIVSEFVLGVALNRLEVLVDCPLLILQPKEDVAVDVEVSGGRFHDHGDRIPELGVDL